MSVSSSTCLEEESTKGLIGPRTAFLGEKGNGLSWQRSEFQQSPQSSKGDDGDEAMDTFPQINSLSGREKGLTLTGSINTEKLKAPQRRETKALEEAHEIVFPMGTRRFLCLKC